MKNIELVIKIPEKEFGRDLEDKFQDFFKRLEAEISHHMNNGTNLVCGNYELETIQMFIQTFANCIQLPKGHGKLKDTDKIVTEIDSAYPYVDKQDIKQWLFRADTIIEIDTESEDKE